MYVSVCYCYYCLCVGMTVYLTSLTIKVVSQYFSIILKKGTAECLNWTMRKANLFLRLTRTDRHSCTFKDIISITITRIRNTSRLCYFYSVYSWKYLCYHFYVHMYVFLIRIIYSHKTPKGVAVLNLRKDDNIFPEDWQINDWWKLIWIVVYIHMYTIM